MFQYDTGSIHNSCDSLRVHCCDEEQISTLVTVPFLVTTHKLNDTILNFNAIKDLVQNKNDRESNSQSIANSIWWSW